MIFVQVGSTIRFPNTPVVVTKRTTGQPDPDEPLRGFGTHFELDQSVAADMIIQHTTMMPQWLFDTLGWTEQELLKYSSPGAWNEAIMPKLRATWIALGELRDRIEQQGAAALDPPEGAAS